MNQPIRRVGPFVAALLLVATAISSSPAQDPFGGPGAGAAAGAPAPADTKGGAAKAVEALNAAAEAAKRPLVLKYLDENKPTTPEQFLKAAQLTLNIGRADESKKYLAGFVAAMPDEATMAALARQFGSDFFLRISLAKDLQPEGGQVGTAVLDALKKVVRDPARIQRLIAALADADAARRQIARIGLAEGGADAALALIAALADDAQASLRRAIQGTLLEMKIDSEGPLVAALESRNETLLVPVIQTLAAMRSDAALTRLVSLSVDAGVGDSVRQAAQDAVGRISGGAPGPDVAERFLRRSLEQRLERARILQPALDGPQPVWQWDAMAGGPVMMTLPETDVALLEARKTAADLALLKPESADYGRLKLMTALEADKVLTGLDRRLPRGDGTAAAMAGSNAADANAVLAEALKRNRVVAATAAAEVLGDIGDSSALERSGGEESPLALAMRHSDRRLRFTAAMSIARIGPKRSFPGASRVTETLAHFAATGGMPRVLVGHPRGGAGQTLVGFMNELGYEAQVASTGRGLQDEVVQSADYDFVLISDMLDRQPMKEVVQWVRRDYRTAQLPVGVMARAENYEELRQHFNGDSRTFVFLAVHDLETARVLVERLVKIAGRARISADERMVMGAEALDALAAIASTQEATPVYDLLRSEKDLIRALATPGLSAKAARVLSFLGTSKSQAALLDFASETARPLADRQAASAAFTAAARRRGVLLTKEQIHRQYERYNASARLDAETQALLGSILDTIESRAVAAAGTQP